MTILAHNAAEVQPIIDREWIGQSEPTPLELLDGPTLDECESWVCDGDDPTHYTTVIRDGRVVSTDRPRYEARELEAGWIVWDCQEQRQTHRFHGGRDARDMAEDLNAEDFEPVLMGTLPWFEAAAPCEHFDTPIKLAPRRAAKAIDRRADELAYPSF